MTAGFVFDAIVLAGGEGRRFEGASKPDVEVDGRRMLDHVLDAVAGARRIALVAPPAVRPVRDDPRIVQTMEDPPRGGPAAGVAAGLVALDAVEGGAGGGAGVPVVVLSCDVPRVGPAVPRLLAALAELDAAAGTTAHDSPASDAPAVPGSPAGPAPAAAPEGAARWNATEPAVPAAPEADGVALATWEAPSEPAPGRPARPQSMSSAPRPQLQRLAAVYRRESLAAAIAAHGGPDGGLHGVSMRRFLADLDLRPVVARGSEAQDVDSWADLARLDVAGAVDGPEDPA